LSLGQLLFFHSRGGRSTFFHHTAEGIFAAALFADMDEFVRAGFAMAFGHELVGAPGAFMPGHDFGFRFRAGLGGRFNDGNPAILALGTKDSPPGSSRLPPIWPATKSAGAVGIRTCHWMARVVRRKNRWRTYAGRRGRT